MANSTAKTSFNPEDRAIYPNHYRGVRKASVVLSKAKNCPKDYNFNTFHGYLCDRLNAKHKSLQITVGELGKLIDAKSVPAKLLKAIKSYKDLQELEKGSVLKS
tara:strand:- start:465 stop:776 length:312 start_codon:yes stop_codon:yes gene_type:complete